MPENLNPEQQLEYLKELRRKYEEVLKDAEKSGDYSEAQKLKQELDERLTALEAQFPKPEAKKELKETSVDQTREFMDGVVRSVEELLIEYKVALSDAQKTGDYSEAEKLKEELNERLTFLGNNSP